MLLFQPEAEMVRVEGDRPRDIRHLIAHAVHAEDARRLVHHALLRLFRREPPLIKQGYADRVSEHRFSFGIGAFLPHDPRLGDLRASWIFAP